MPKRAPTAHALRFTAACQNPLLQSFIEDCYYEDSNLPLPPDVKKARQELLQSWNSFTATSCPHLVEREWTDSALDPLEARAYEFLAQQVQGSSPKVNSDGVLALLTTFLAILLANIETEKSQPVDWVDVASEWSKKLQDGRFD